MSNVIIDGVEYAPVSDVAKSKEGLEYVIIRADRAGIFAGYLELEEGSDVILQESRRIWYWEGAASISQMAIDGVALPDKCKFPEAVKRQKIKGVIEIIPCTKKAMESIQSVKNWAYED